MAEEGWYFILTLIAVISVYWYFFKYKQRQQPTTAESLAQSSSQITNSKSSMNDKIEKTEAEEKLPTSERIDPAYKLDDNEDRICDLCHGASKRRAAEVFCRECEQFQCINCKTQHQNLPSSINHTSLSVEEGILLEETRIPMNCDLCKLIGQVSTALKLCIECQNILLCAECEKKHAVNKATRFHTLTEDFTSFRESSSCDSDANTNGTVQTKQQKETEKDLICISVKLETENYIRFVLLLIKCGTKVLRQILIWGLERENTTLSGFLSSKKVIICKHSQIAQYRMNILYPRPPKQTNIDQWDISLLCFISMEYFRRKMSTPEITAVKKIREMRNDILSHHGNACIDKQRFLNLWNELTLVIHTIGYDMKEADRSENENWMNKLCSAKLDMNTAIEEIKKLDQTDDLFKSIQISINDILGEVSIIKQDLTVIKKDLLDIQPTLEIAERLERAVHALYGVVHVHTDKESTKDQAETALLSACKKDTHSSESREEQTLKETMNRLNDEIGKTGAEIQDVDQGSIIFTFKCKSIECILDLLDVFESVSLQNHVSEIADALTDVIGNKVHLTAYLLRQPLLEVLRIMQPTDSGKQFIEMPTGLEGFHHVVKTFAGDSILKHELSTALSHCLGRMVALETPVDLIQLQHAINVTKEQLALPRRSQGVSTEKMEAEFRDKTTTEEMGENDSITAKHVIFKGQLTSGEGQPSKDRTTTGQGEIYSATNEEIDKFKNTDTRLDKDCPGQPRASAVLADTVTLVWEPPSNFRRENHYLISYSTDISSNYNWKLYPIEAKYETAILTGLKTKTTYVFRVRAVYNDAEGPYSPNSLEITTTESLASRFLPVATKIQDDEYSPTTYRLPVTEIKSARDGTNKTKKYEICVPHKGYVKSKTILLVGATGTGKTTLVDGIVNYALGVSWNDSFRFTTAHPEESEEARLKNQALSQTDWITCYTINHEKGSRLKYQLHVLDTPGFGDTQGPNRDKEIATQLKELFSQEEPKGVTYIDAICFLVKSPDARLTVSQKYVFESVLSLFGKDVENNICYLITFADNNDPPVLAAMKESNLPSGRNFTFNNSGLFARNENADGDAGQIFWNMGLDSFSEFFEQLNYAETRSLQQTKDVLDERQLLETTVSNLQPQIDLGMSKVVELKKEKSILKKHFPLKKDARNFEYETEETKPQKRIFPAGKHAARCQNCYQICNETYTYTDNETCEKRCRICPNKCPWKDHTDIQSLYEYIPVKVKKQYWNMQQKVEKVKGHPPSQDQIVEQLEKELRQLLARVQFLMFAVKSCTDRLSEIALRRPNPLSIIDYIDLMIENEKLEQRPGFENRVLGLKEIRKRTDITEEYEKFSKEASKVLKEVGETKSIWFRSVFEKANILMAEITIIT